MALTGECFCGEVTYQIHGVTLGCLNGDPKIKLQRHIYVGSKAGWEDIPVGVPQYPESPP